MRRVLAPLGLILLAVALGLTLFSSPSRPVAASGSGVLTDDAAPTSSASNSAGAELFAENCSTCHGANAQGSRLAPNLRGVGAETVDLWISSGWMPLSVPTAEPIKKPDKFDNTQTVQIADYIGRLGGPAIPTVDLKGANVSVGASLFSLNCAPCHTITGAGDALSNGLSAPALHGLSTLEVEEAVETGPGNMPRFTPGAITPSQVKDVVAFVTEDIEHPTDTGGLGLGGVGPVAEGFIGLFIGVGACMVVALWIGDRTEREEDEHEDGDEAPAHV